MNCANHSDIAAVAFCRTCGKPLCQPMHPRRPRSDLLRILPGRAHGRRLPGRGFVSAAANRISAIRGSGLGPKVPPPTIRARIRLSPESWPDSSPLAWARSTPASTQKGWPTW